MRPAVAGSTLKTIQRKYSACDSNEQTAKYKKRRTHPLEYLLNCSLLRLQIKFMASGNELWAGTGMPDNTCDYGLQPVMLANTVRPNSTGTRSDESLKHKFA